MQLTQGQRIPLSTLIQGADLTLSIEIKSAHVIDYVCFGIDADGKLSDDRYMIFFNQPASPCASVRQVNGSNFQLALAGLPASWCWTLQARCTASTPTVTYRKSWIV